MTAYVPIRPKMKRNPIGRSEYPFIIGFGIIESRECELILRQKDPKYYEKYKKTSM